MHVLFIYIVRIILKQRRKIIQYLTLIKENPEDNKNEKAFFFFISQEEWINQQKLMFFTLLKIKYYSS